MDVYVWCMPEMSEAGKKNMQWFMLPQGKLAFPAAVAMINGNPGDFSTIKFLKRLWLANKTEGDTYGIIYSWQQIVNFWTCIVYRNILAIFEGEQYFLDINFYVPQK